MSLKTDYKDDVFTGNRKYTQTENSDGTVSFEDSTEYSQQGDNFAAEDLNAITTAINTNTTDVSGLKTRMTTAESDIDTLQSKMTTAEGDIDTLQSQMSTANSNINTLKTMGYVKTVNATINSASQNVGLGGTYTSADYFVTWGMGTGITSAQIKAMGKAQPVMTSISGTNAVFSCKGGAPSTGFPISIVVFKV